MIRWNAIQFLIWITWHIVQLQSENATAAKKQEDDNNVCLGAGNWNSIACVCLIHALIDHYDLKTKFLNCLNLPAGHSSVKNSQQAHKQMCGTYWLTGGMIKTLLWKCFIASYSYRVHFLDVILYAEVSYHTSATAEKVEDKWSSMILEMNCCITNWQIMWKMQLIKCLAILLTVLSKHFPSDKISSKTANFISFIFGRCLTGMVYWGLLFKS